MLSAYFLSLVKHFVHQQNKIVVAVSGGVDSMVMLDLCRQANLNILVAHCNFKLRGTASDLDEHLVKSYCATHHVPCFSKSFDTKKESENHKISIQMVARELRYQFFNELVQQHGAVKIMTAHHADDAIETFFIHLLRGSGAKGLGGIPAENAQVIRPLIMVSKQEILGYAKQHHVPYRNDSSNDTDDYLRNKIRHHLIPALQQINTGFSQQILKCMGHLRDEHRLLEAFIKSAEYMTERQPGIFYISLQKIFSSDIPQALLFKIIADFGFNESQCMQLAQTNQPRTGAMLLSASHRLLVDRSHLIIAPRQGHSIKQVNIEQSWNADVWLKQTGLTVFLPDAKQNQEMPSHAVTIDYKKLVFPLLWRGIKPGDRMIPAGMHQQKKISDILINKKVNRFDKETACVLVNADGQIIWLADYCLSEAFKATSQTHSILKLVLPKPKPKIINDEVI